MELTALLGLLLALLGPRTSSAVATTETTTTETTTTESTTTETTTTDSTTAPPAPPPLNLTAPGTPASPPPPPPQNATLFPTSHNSSAFNGTPGSVWIGTVPPPPPPTNGSRVAPPPLRDPRPTSPAGGGSDASEPSGTAAVGTPGKNPTAETVGGEGGGGSATPGKSGPPPPRPPPPDPPGALQLLLRVPLSFRVLNRNFSRDLLQPGSAEHRALSYRVLSVFDSVYGCARCAARHSYKGCSELSFSQGSVLVRSTLVFGSGSAAFSAESAAKELRGSVDPRGFIMELQLADIQSGAAPPPPAAQPPVPAWAVALLALVCVLLLLSALTCALLTTCSCRRRSRGKLDVFSQKDSYRPMAAYPPYQSHGRYEAPAGKHNPYSQVAGTIAGGGTFTYTNPSAGSDNL